MISILLALAVTLPAADQPTPRKASSIAPSLPALTREEEEKLDAIIDRFIQADTGRLKGAAAVKAKKEFDSLKSEAIPALLRGLQTAAKINHSCPVLMITKKLHNLLVGSDDNKLLEFARDEIGAAMHKSRHANTLRTLRVKLALRQNALARMKPAGPAGMTTSQLARAAGAEKGAKLEGVLRELEKRKGPEVLEGLARAARNSDAKASKAGRDSLDRFLTRQPVAQVKEAMKSKDAEVRKGAIRAAVKHASLVPGVIDLLTEASQDIRAEARAALKSRSKEDFGPEDDATIKEQQEAQKKWRAWWKKNEKKK